MLKTIISEFTPQTGVRATDSEAALRRLRVPPLTAVPPVAIHAS